MWSRKEIESEIEEMLAYDWRIELQNFNSSGATVAAAEVIELKTDMASERSGELKIWCFGV
jgi:hypothetical protein